MIDFNCAVVTLETKLTKKKSSKGIKMPVETSQTTPTA